MIVYQKYLHLDTLLDEQWSVFLKLYNMRKGESSWSVLLHATRNPAQTCNPCQCLLIRVTYKYTILWNLLIHVFLRVRCLFWMTFDVNIIWSCVWYMICSIYVWLTSMLFLILYILRVQFLCCLNGRSVRGHTHVSWWWDQTHSSTSMHRFESIILKIDFWMSDIWKEPPCSWWNQRCGCLMLRRIFNDLM